MTKQSGVVDDVNILDEIIDNATNLPLESQKLVLLLAKGMAYTRYCITKQNADQARKPSGQRTA